MRELTSYLCFLVGRIALAIQVIQLDQWHLAAHVRRLDLEIENKKLSYRRETARQLYTRLSRLTH